MVHHFNIEIAKLYGIEEAILIENLYYWISKNGANKKHLHDGRYWTYNSATAFAVLFPYMSADKIRRHIDKLCATKDKDDNEIAPFLLKGNYNAEKLDKTLWYSFSDAAIEVLSKNGYDVANLRDDLAKTRKADCENAKPIPNNKTNNKEESNDSKKGEIDFELIRTSWNKIAEKCNLRALRDMNGKRKDKIRSLFKNCNTTQEELIKVIISLPYADDWVLGKIKGRDWSATFDWLIANTNNWYLQALEGGLHTQNKKAFQDMFDANDNLYRPQLDGFNLMWNDTLGIYISMYDLDMLADGYTRDDRPSSARVRRNSINYRWNVGTKSWEAE